MVYESPVQRLMRLKASMPHQVQCKRFKEKKAAGFDIPLMSKFNASDTQAAWISYRTADGDYNITFAFAKLDDLLAFTDKNSSWLHIPTKKELPDDF